MKNTLGKITYTIVKVDKEYGEPTLIEENINGEKTIIKYSDCDIHRRNIINLGRWDYRRKYENTTKQEDKARG